MNNEIQYISPFKNFCITVGGLPTSYLESMSYYEMLCWLCKYLENTINPAINQNAKALEELQDYVANYFDNLDVQEEINNKLDEMVESGELTTLISQALDQVDLQSDVNNKLDEMAESGELAHIINVEMIGTLSNLTTTDKTDLVSAINEVDEHADTNASNMGTLSNLTTNHKSDLVSAINEVDGHTDTNASNITLTDNKIGSLSNLETGTKTNIVSAINETVDKTTFSKSVIYATDWTGDTYFLAKVSPTPTCTLKYNNLHNILYVSTQFEYTTPSGIGGGSIYIPYPDDIIINGFNMEMSVDYYVINQDNEKIYNNSDALYFRPNSIEIKLPVNTHGYVVVRPYPQFQSTLVN